MKPLGKDEALRQLSAMGRAVQVFQHLEEVLSVAVAAESKQADLGESVKALSAEKDRLTQETATLAAHYASEEARLREEHRVSLRALSRDRARVSGDNEKLEAEAKERMIRLVAESQARLDAIRAEIVVEQDRLGAIKAESASLVAKIRTSIGA